MKKRILAALLALLCLAGCGGSKSLTPVRPAPPDLPEALDADSASALTEASLRLLREAWTDNVLLSPLSLLSVLGMTANGARGGTLAQMEDVLGLPLDRMNAAMALWGRELEGLDMANAVWLRDDGSFVPEDAFLETAGAWYGAEVFPVPMDGGTLREINDWVKRQTHGRIDGILEEIPGSAVMYLINALALDAEWEEVYRTDQIREGTFTAEDGRQQPVELMYGLEGRFLEDAHGTGFLKPYKGGRWAFAALLPERGMALEDYAAALTGEGLQAMLSGAAEETVETAIPQFQCVCQLELSGVLKALGMTDAFEQAAADLSGLGTSGLGPLYVSEVLHKTCIAVDARGTQAGAASAVSVDSGGAGMMGSAVILDRPFLYMLVDLETNLPVFLGAATDMGA